MMVEPHSGLGWQQKPAVKCDRKRMQERDGSYLSEQIHTSLSGRRDLNAPLPIIDYDLQGQVIDCVY